MFPVKSARIAEQLSGGVATVNRAVQHATQMSAEFRVSTPTSYAIDPFTAFHFWSSGRLSVSALYTFARETSSAI
jgi:hypothetical protein